MVRFSALIKQFAEQGEKTGWTYIDVPAATAEKIRPATRKTYRVKGLLDAVTIKGVALTPMGEGNFILVLNASLRKMLKKRKGAMVEVQLEEDKEKIQPPEELMTCLEDEPAAFDFFCSLTYGHQNYFTKWIESAKTETTRTKRIAHTVDALSKHMDYGAMIRSLKASR